MTESWQGDETNQAIARMFNEGQSYDQIGAALGMTRNAVASKIGRARSYGMVTRELNTRSRNRRTGQRTKRGVKQEGDGSNSLARPIRPNPYAKDFRPRRCRWIYGDPKHPDWEFCNRHQVAGSAYCDGHRHQAYTRTPEERAAAAEAKRYWIDFHKKGAHT